mmetsp:Transcript_22442/g.40499  ORF Transcript_22442/g.40499 Transcript_22442/m.40499 type:complete len:220 (-) Transcript_22442:210-869(-)
MLEGSPHRVVRSVATTLGVLHCYKSCSHWLCHALKSCKGLCLPCEDSTSVGAGSLRENKDWPFPALLGVFGDSCKRLRVLLSNRSSPCSSSTQCAQQRISNRRTICCRKNKNWIQLHAQVEHICQTLHIGKNNASTFGIKAKVSTNLWWSYFQSSMVSYRVASRCEPNTKSHKRHSTAPPCQNDMDRPPHWRHNLQWQANNFCRTKPQQPKTKESQAKH